MNATALPYATPAEPGQLPAAVLAFLVHAAFFALLVFGFNWKSAPRSSETGMAVELWNEPRSAQPELKLDTKVPDAPKPPVVVPPAPPKPEIALKDKPKEKEIKPILPTEKIQPKPNAPDTAKALQQQIAREQTAAQAQLIGDFQSKILAKIKSRIILPPNLPGNPIAEFEATLLPGGDVLEIKLIKTSGFAVFDTAVERAIRKASPLPLPPDPSLFSQFRNLSLKVHYRE